jgi:RNA polymerase sigma-70 factor (ECF subfamily)
VEGADPRGEGATVVAPAQVRVELGRVDPARLAVEAGGQGVTDVGAAGHARVVDSRRPRVPGYGAGIDELTELLVAARDGDRVALAAVIRGSQGEVWRLAAHLVGPDAADDVTQDTFVRAWRSLPGYRAEASARTWLLVIARRACADAVRARVRRRRLTARLLDRAVTGDDRADDATGAHALGALVAGLDPDRREALVLTQVLGCSYAEAAEVCGVPIGTIRSRIARARETLLEQLAAAETG